jgi:1,4-alpha-glucan branching enzyme
MAKKTVKTEIEAPKEVPKNYPNVMVHSLFTDFDIDLFKGGKHYRLYEKMGAHTFEKEGVVGTYFAVWAPSARSVSVIGNFNYWDKNTHQLNVRWDSSGIWEGFVPNVGRGEVYKFCISTQDGRHLEKIDPYGHFFEEPPKTASIVWDNWYEWDDKNWMDSRAKKNALDAPFSAYEVHLGSWKRDPNNPDRFLSYQEIARDMVAHVKEIGFTHVEFMPVMEHPYAPSWGYQVTGYFAPSSRFGDPQGFMHLVEELHKNNIGVILDWVPSHFPGDAHALYEFDGTHLYEHPDMKRGYHPDWKSYIFNYGRPEVRSFLISNAMYWLDRFHADGLRVDAVASMLYLDYSREIGEWDPNEYGGNQNLEAVSLFKELNEAVYVAFPDIQIIAEESTAFPSVSRPVWMGGLGFGMKWMMGWMNDTLKYFEKEALYRKWHQNQITFSAVYGFSENFMLPLSHDEVVYGKQSLLNKMPGDSWQKFGNLRLLFTYMYTHFGTKLLFQGGEFGQSAEWNFSQSLDWHQTEQHSHQGIMKCVAALNKLYRSEPALHEKQFSHEGFEWLDTSDTENSVIIYKRSGYNEKDNLIIALNMTPVPRENYRIGVPTKGTLNELFNSDSSEFGGTNHYLNGTKKPDAIEWQGKPFSVELSLPPLGGVVLKVK